jgi:LuxR family maltose regulon positive regulatory protein
MNEQIGRINRKSVPIDVLVLLALVCHKVGEEAGALEKLPAALSLAEKGGWIRNFVDLGAPMIDLLERLNQAKSEHIYAQQVLAACKVEAQSNMPSDPNAEESLSLSGQAAVPILSNRETEILHFLAEGLSNKEIASVPHIPTETVKTHVQNIYRKLAH